ncbi:MAG: hypothetical protein ACFFDR_06275 [Candidatus Thorarchaeota archaeon]
MEPMITSKKCPNCSSRRIAGPQRLWSAGVEAGTIGSKLLVLICTDCGHVEMFTDEKGIKRLRKNGKFTLNIPNPRITECPSCGTPFRISSFYCRKCGAERDFNYLDTQSQF